VAVAREALVALRKQDDHGDRDENGERHTE
jgi:hypothetical protein